MNLRIFKKLKTHDFVELGLFIILSTWVYTGFYFPGSYILAYGSIPKTIMWFTRIAMPLFSIGLIIPYIYIRMHKMGRKELALFFVVSSLGFYICYHIADSLYQQWFDNHRQEYHPYLQLVPSFDNRLNDTTAYAKRIFCLGGSTTEFPDRAGRDWPSRVEAILRKKNGQQNIEVYNLGKGWYTSLHTLINYETNLRKYRPSAILIMQSLNDLLQNADFSYMSHGAFREDYGHFYGPVNRIINRRSLWHYLRDVFSGLWYAAPRKPITTDFFPGLKPYERNIRTIIELARFDGTKVILMTEPYLMKRNLSEEELSAIRMIQVEAINDTMVWTSKTLLSGMEQYNNTLRRIAQEENLPLIELDKEVPKTLFYFRDEVHYQDTTFSLIAPFIADKLFEYLSLDGTRQDYLQAPK